MPNSCANAECWYFFDGDDGSATTIVCQVLIVQHPIPTNSKSAYKMYGTLNQTLLAQTLALNFTGFWRGDIMG